MFPPGYSMRSNPTTKRSLALYRVLHRLMGVRGDAVCIEGWRGLDGNLQALIICATSLAVILRRGLLSFRPFSYFMTSSGSLMTQCFVSVPVSRS